MNNTGYIAAITRGHNAGVCLLKDGEMIFSIEEERLSRRKYDGGPYASMLKILEYTDKIDYLVIAHTQSLEQSAGRVDYSGDDVYTGLARKLKLIDHKITALPHPQVIDLSFQHHKLHAACAFYRSGFKDAVAVIVDGAGTFIPLQIGSEQTTGYETESIFECAYPALIQTLYKHIGTRGPNLAGIVKQKENDQEFTSVITDTAGIVKVYEAVTQYCGFSSIEAGKTMGLSPYGKENPNIPKLFNHTSKISHSNRNIIIPAYPNGAIVNFQLYEELLDVDSNDVTTLQNRRDMAYACQKETQKQVADLIRSAVEITGNKNVVVSGGYGLNCVANYYYLEELKDLDINLYIEPISNDAGTAIGAALWFYHEITKDATVRKYQDSLYLGPKYDHNRNEVISLTKKYFAEIEDTDNEKIVDLLTSKNIVAIFQGRSENGPRALGNRTLLFDPRFRDGKDFVNQVKHREYFRPFAGSILKEHVHEWFDLRGMDESPTMMYAVNCQPGMEEKIPSIIHVDNTCRIQTVTEEQNKHYYDLINVFFKKTGIPIVFNTSFNLGGDPLVETLEDAFETLSKSDIDYLYLPEYGKLITIKNK